MHLRFALGAWSNKHFDQALFPVRTPHAEYLARYATRFDAVEADILYHQMPVASREEPEVAGANADGPTAKATRMRAGPTAVQDEDEEGGPLVDQNGHGLVDVSRWVRQTPDGFTFLPKMHIGAMLDPADPAGVERAERFLKGVEPLRAAGKLGPILLQFHPEQPRDTHAVRLQELLHLAPPGTFAVELRHTSWFTQAVEELLTDMEAPLVWSTFPKAFAPPWATAGYGYLRFSGKYAHKRGRHVTQADRTKDILEMRSRLSQAAWPNAYVVVTNPFEGNAVDSLPKVAAALAGHETGRKFSHKPGEPLIP